MQEPAITPERFRGQLGAAAIEELRDKLIDALWREFLGLGTSDATRGEYLAQLRAGLGLLASATGEGAEPPADPADPGV
jgi:hypothetical protein